MNSRNKYSHLQTRYKIKSRKSRFNWFSLLLIGLGSATLATVLIGLKLKASVPESVADVSSYARPNTITIKARDGSVLKEIGEVSHQKIDLEKVPDYLSQAFVASEDVRFYKHTGFDLRGIARAMVANIKAGGAQEGASTITQQLARVAYLTQEKKIWRKLKEIVIAQEIEKNLTKQDILETYLNLVYFGSGSYGVADATWVYFGKKPDQLNLSEVATLAGIVPAPSIYSPFSDPELALKRRNGVLKKMVAAGYLTPEAAQRVIDTPLVTNRKHPQRLQRKFQYFTNYVEDELPKLIDADTLAEGGIVVDTTLVPEWQIAAEATVSYGLKRYAKWQKFEEAAIVAIEPQTGEIKAMVGGKDFGDNQYNRVTQAQRQPGSTFKPFVYTAAIAAGFSPYKTYLDAEFYVDGYKPKNNNKKYLDEKVSIYKALKSSINTVALQTLVDVGGNPVVKLAQKMGIKSELQPTYSLALGSWEVNLLELTNAYGTFANQGIYQESYGIRQVSDRQGKIIYQADFPPQEAIDPQTVAMMTWMLKGVVQAGTGIPADIGRPSAGKTGTTDDSRDLWYVGYIPQAAAGIWLGNDDNQPTKGSSGVAAEMWRHFMLQVIKGMPIKAFPPRPNLTGREKTIALEPFKTKKTYHIRQPKSSPKQYRRTYPRTYRSRTTSTPGAANRNVAPAANTNQKAPVLKKDPQSKTNTFIREHKQKFNPANNSNGDWVKERLGR